MENSENKERQRKCLEHVEVVCRYTVNQFKSVDEPVNLRMANFCSIYHYWYDLRTALLL